MKHTIDTGLGVDISKKALEKAMQGYQARFSDYQPRFAWTGADRGEFSFTAKGISLRGTVVVRDRAIDLDMQVPLVFRIFQGRALDIIRDQVEQWIERARRGELD